MEVFNLTFVQMLNMFLLILTGFILKRCKVLPDGSDAVISRLETYAFAPALAICNLMTNCTMENFVQNFPTMIYGLATVLVAIILAYPLSCFFVKNDKNNKNENYKKQVYKYALTFGNYGYMGNFLVLGIWGHEMLFKYSMYSFLINVVCYAWGIYILIPKSQDSPGILANLKNGLLRTPFISVILGMVLGITGLGKHLPPFVHTALENAGNCMGPVAMVLAGVVIGGFNFKELISIKKVYAVSFLRLILIPAVFIIILKFLGTSDEIVTFTLIAFAAPLGLNTIVYPAAFGGDTKTGAAMTMISHTLAVITIPLMYLLFVVKM